MTKSLYEQYPDGVAGLVADGFPAIVEMSRHFTRCGHMSNALGFDPSGGAVNNWLLRRKTPSKISEISARNWLDARISGAGQPQQAAPKAATVAAQIVKPEGVILMVVASVANAERAKKMLALLGCEVEEI